MPLGILNNIPSLQAENELTLTASALNNTLEQLASGSRINSGADDPAGLSIANGLQANISALTQSVSNANDGVGQLQLADGALAQVTNLLNTAVTLATESATGTVSNGQRTAIQAQYASILAEINQIGTATTYNGQSVFQSGTSTNVNQVVSANSGTTAPITLGSALTVGDATSVTAGGVTFTYTASAGVANPNVQITSGTALTAASTLIASGVLTITRGGVATTYTNGTGAVTLQSLVTAINTGANVAGSGTLATTGVTVGGGAATGLSAAIVGGQLQITDTAGNNNLAVTGEATAIVAGETVADSTAPTVQNLINAINSSADTAGAQAALVGGQLQITDPLNRADLAVSTNDTVLGAPVSGAPTAFTNTTTTAAATVNTNELAGNAGTVGTPITAATVLTTGGVDQFTAGGKTFTFTATAGQTVGALIAAINNPSDAAGLHAYLGTIGSSTAAQLIVTDPNANNDVAVGSGNTETVLGTYTNPTTSGSTTTNIFLSDSTAIGSAQIAVQIGGLSTAALTNGSGAQAVDLATTDLSTQTDAQTALTLINSAITNIASVRGTLGASVNRLTAASNVINSQVQNLTSAENTITAADIPSVVANLTKYSILEQTGISALAQANQQQQLVLKLLQ
jgi:flagellin